MILKEFFDFDPKQLTLNNLLPVLETEDSRLIEKLAISARDITRQYFGRTIVLYAPLYISNYCENYCIYCGFSAQRCISRKKLSLNEIDGQCKAVHKSGIQNILILTGESRAHSPVSYIKEAVKIAKKYFSNIALEVNPMETPEYVELFDSGVDGLTIYQETYDEKRYKQLHLKGPKVNYKYRHETPQRAAEAKIRHISIGILLGLYDWRKDVVSLFNHLSVLEKKYPGVEYSLSFPRLQQTKEDSLSYYEVSDLDMLKIISCARLLFTRVGINLSTRESPRFRDKILEFGITKMSAGSSTSVGGYSRNNGDNEKQFKINDNRTVLEVKKMLKAKGYDPVITDWRRIS